ncbi:MAG: ACT domain-containing protein [Ruminococcaceae bacterium]|nr:ACT domain-containing protein [Oscillospiraceae bacterium]
MAETEATPRLLVVDARALPEVFERVLVAKRLIATGEAASASEAARQAGISRTAFYKYRDMVFPYDVSATGGDLVTVHFLLNDRPGVLSALLTAFAEAGANILTVNQNIPVGGAASVSVTARCDRLGVSAEGLLLKLSAVAGVKRILRINSE